MPVTYSLHKIHNECFSFHPGSYSRFKFGDEVAAKKFGEELAYGFINEHLLHGDNLKQFVVVSSPYSFIPTATFAMKNHFVFRLNRWLAEHELPVVQETKVHRTITYKDDYGELNAEERMRLIGNDSFHIDKAFLQEKTILFLDDIRITGSHERMIMKMANEYNLTNDIFLLYFAELANKNIHPNIENYLNYYCVKSIFDLDNIIKGERFSINTRLVKYILNADLNSFKVFIKNQNPDFINQLYDSALGNSYHCIDAYLENFKILQLRIKLISQTNDIVV